MKLDARQRAMLAEMGVRVWLPPPASESAPPSVSSPAPPAAAPVRPSVSKLPRTGVAATPAAAAAPSARPPALRLNPPQALFPVTEGAPATGQPLHPWLIVLDSPTPSEPLAGDAGQLFANMLRAMGWHGRSEVLVATVERVAMPGDDGSDAAVLALCPAVVLALGLAAARVLLGGNAPLEALRAGVQQLADGTPVIVSYAPAYLLRAPHAKGRAWADLCRALELVHAGAVP